MGIQAKLKVKVKKKRIYLYNENYHLQRLCNNDKNLKLLVYKCDMCNEGLTQLPDNFEQLMKVKDEIDDSFESNYDKSTYEQGPKLLLCNNCKKEYLLPGYQ